MLINLSISKWSAKKFDKKVTHEIEKAHNATKSGRFNKSLIASEDLKEIQKIANRARTFHYFNTLPWGDNGDRLLSSKNYFKYITELAAIKNEFEIKVGEFVQRYPDLKAEAKIRLNGMFNESDYPDTARIKDKFNIKFTVLPIQDADDFRVALGDEESEKIRNEVKDEVNRRVQRTLYDMVERVREAVSHMAQKLADPEAVFRDSLVDNLANLVDVLPRLNYIDDPQVNKVVNIAKPLCVDVNSLRNQPAFREQTAQKAAYAVGDIKNILSLLK